MHVQSSTQYGLISQGNISKKSSYEGFIEPIPLQTAGFVQACQHLLDLFTCRPQMLLSVQSPTEAVRCTFSKHSLSKPQGLIDRRQSLLNDGYSQRGSKQCWRTKGKAWPFAQQFGRSTLVPSYLFTDDTSKRKMATDEESDLRKRVTLAELAPGRLNEISQFKSNTNLKV